VYSYPRPSSPRTCPPVRLHLADSGDDSSVFSSTHLLLIIGWATLAPTTSASPPTSLGDGDHLSLQLTAHRTPSGQTIGMRVVSVRCVDQDGYPLTYARAANERFSTLRYWPRTFHHLYATSTPRRPIASRASRRTHFLRVLLPHLIDLLWVAWTRESDTARQVRTDSRDQNQVVLVPRSERQTFPSVAISRGRIMTRSSGGPNPNWRRDHARHWSPTSTESRDRGLFNHHLNSCFESPRPR